MQTFCPYPDYLRSAATLDNKRLGKQRVETLQIMQQLLGYRLVTIRRFYRRGWEQDEDGSWHRATICRAVPLPRDMWHIEPLETAGWANRPAVRMWRGHVPALLDYQHAICHEWVNHRGYKDTCMDKTSELVGQVDASLLFPTDKSAVMPPPWLGGRKFHDSHKSNLLSKDPKHYSKFFTRTKPGMPYVWPKGAGA